MKTLLWDNNVVAWCRKNWQLFGLAALVVLGIVIGAFGQMCATKPDTKKQLSVEMAEFEAVNETAVIMVEQGKEEALKRVVDDHRDIIKGLDDDAKKTVETLKDDPIALSRYLVRIGHQLRAKQAE